MKKGNIEIRSIGTLRALEDADVRTIEGLAIPVEQRSELLGGSFYEIIRSTAVTPELINDNDIQLIMNHNDNLGVLGRSKFGKGTLQLSITERGLEFSCELPKTAAGDAILEGVRRGDFDGVSFAFWPEEDEWTENEDGTYTRSILKIGYLREISVLSELPAYSQTDVALRSLDEFKKKQEELRAKEEEEKEEDEEEKKSKDEEPKDEEPSDDKEQPSDEDKGEDKEPEKEDEGDKDKDEEDKEKEKRNKDTNISTGRQMKKNRFSIAQVLRAKVNGTELDKRSQSILDSAAQMNAEAGIQTSGFAIPFEMRDISLNDDDKEYIADAVQDGVDSLGNPVTGQELNATLTSTQGKDTIRDEYQSLIDPIFNASVLGEFTRLTGLKGNIVFPRHNGVACAWEEELAKAEESTMKFDGVKMTPKRLTSYVTISKQLLTQSDYNIEAIVRQELVNSIGRKLQATLFGTQEGTATTPQGLFYGVDASSSSDQVPETYAGLVAIEEAAEEANVGGALKYVIKPSIKADYRTTLKSSGVSGYIFEAGEVLGVPTVVTNDCPGLIYGNLKDVVIAQWGNIDIVVDTITLAAYGAIRLVINTYWDIKPIFPVTGEGTTKTEVPTIICKLPAGE